ncbi:MAG: alpha/beta fold hydrolase [Clostridia bacterium]|nr:alpha/beta fold hydrolase [Clostridia bacterium]
MEWYVILILALVGAFLFLFLFPVLVMSYVLYSVLLVRNSKKKWGRECSIPDDEEYRRMFDEGLAWEEKWREKKTVVSVKSGRLRLAGEYFDFGGDRAVIIISGRMESLLYSYFFAEPFRRAGCSVLVIDNRAHGESDGKISSLGYREYRDVIEWSRMLHDDFGVGKITLFGICIGASTALFTAVSDKCPDYVDSIGVEGMYVNFYESFVNHMREDRPDRRQFPILHGVMLHIWAISGANVVTDGPVKRISLLKKPILFLHSREDQYSLPEKAELLYDKCKAPKRIVWFDRGKHSRIRINNREKYDDAVIKYIEDLDSRFNGDNP